MTQQDDITQRVLTDDEIRDIITGTHQAFGEFKSGYMLVLGRAIESALLSKLRAPVSNIREGFELTYAADADDPACASDLSHFTNGWQACIMSQVRAPVADERAAFSRAEISFPLTIPENRVYLAGPMTGYKDHNFPEFHAAAEWLRGAGLEVVNPADHGLVDGLSWSDYMRWDLVKLAGCHAVYVLPGWEKSKGASLEIAIARALGMPVFTVEGAVLASAPVAGEAQPVIHQHGFAADNQRLRAINESLDKQLDEVMTERDEYHDIADKLADAIADHLLVEIGEHSSSNCPWMRALDAIQNAAPQASAEYERGHADGWAAGWDQAIKQPQADKDGPWCCERGEAQGVQVCQECAEISAGYQASMRGDKDGGQQRAGDVVEPIAWECTTPLFFKYVTDSKYRKFRPGVRKWYRPYRCASCAALSAPQAEQGERKDG